MTAGALIRLLLAISMLIGPMLGSATCAQSRPLEAAPATMASMPAEMPHMACCPKKEMPRGCAKCPLMALCSLTLAEQRAQVHVVILVVRVDRRATPADEPDRAGRASTPPPKPPRSRA